jgi:menaquinone-dependent protoporphyrinogen IX oxidase
MNEEIMNKLLIIYFTESGSTREAADIIAKQFLKDDVNVDVFSVKQAGSILSYDAIIIGTPNWYGKPASKVRKFLKQNQTELSKIPAAFFFTCLSLSEIAAETPPPFPIYKDPIFDQPAKPMNQMTSWEKSHATSLYIRNLSKIAPKLKLVGMAFFKGRLDFQRLSFFNRMVMKFITLINKEVAAGEYLNPEAIREWVNGLSLKL